MAGTDLLFQCLEWTKQMIDKKQEVVVDIRVGDFKFSFDNKKSIQTKHKSPSQLRRNFERQEEFKVKQTKYKIEASEENEEIKEILTKPETIQKESWDVETQTNTAEISNQETQTSLYLEETGTQTDEVDDLHLVRDSLNLNEKGEIMIDKNETIVELKFSHGMDTWNQVNEHIREVLKMKMKSRAWLTNTGPHFKIIAFVMEKCEYERWKYETLNWENIAKSVKTSRIYR